MFSGTWPPDGKHIASASSDAWTVQVVTSGHQVWSYKAAGFDQIGNVMWSPDRKRLAAGWQGGNVHIFNAP